MKRDIYSLLVAGRDVPVLGRLAYFGLKILGVELPCSVQIVGDLELVHGAFGTVVHSKTRIGARVKIYPGVTIGRADIYRPADQSRFERIIIEDDVILCPGSKVLGKEGVLRVGRGSVLGANAVLLESTGVGEMWAGIPAQRIGPRPDWESSQKP
jgi:serine O-acetyltransferase